MVAAIHASVRLFRLHSYKRRRPPVSGDPGGWGEGRGEWEGAGVTDCGRQQIVSRSDAIEDDAVGKESKTQQRRAKRIWGLLSLQQIRSDVLQDAVAIQLKRSLAAGSEAG